MDANERLDLIKRNAAEIITEEGLKKLLKEKKNPVVYWGTAVTGTPHIAYFFPVLKLADFLKAGFKVKVLLADLHGALDNTLWSDLEKRYNYYKEVIPLMFEAIGVDVKNLEILKGSDFQLKAEYFFDVLKMSTVTSVRDCNKAASEVVKLGDSPKLGGIIYPSMQALDEIYLEADVQYAGLDQRKIMVFARENLPKIGYKANIEIMTPMIPGLIGKKMSASDPKSKIDLLDDEKTVNEKIKNAYCEEGVVEDNGVLAFIKYVIMILKQDKKEGFIVERQAKFGGNISFKTYSELEEAFKAKKLHPQDIKIALAKEINKLLTPMREVRASLIKLYEKAYK